MSEPATTRSLRYDAVDEHQVMHACARAEGGRDADNQIGVTLNIPPFGSSASIQVVASSLLSLRPPSHPSLAFDPGNRRFFTLCTSIVHYHLFLLDDPSTGCASNTFRPCCLSRRTVSLIASRIRHLDVHHLVEKALSPPAVHYTTQQPGLFDRSSVAST